MENQELIDSICHILIEKKMYVDLDTVATVCSYLEKDTAKRILNELEHIND